MRSQEFTLLKETTLGGFPVKVLKIQDQGVDEGGANSGRRGPNSPPDNSPVAPGRVEKTATGIRHHADPSRYGGYKPEPEDDRLLGPQQRWRLSQAVKGVGEEASPMIKPPASRFDSKQAAFAHVREHGGKVFRSTYTDPNTGNKQVSFVVKKEQGVAEGWKEKLGAATVAGAMALGAGGASADTRRVTPDGQGGFTGGWKPTSTQQSTDTAPAQSPASTTQHLSLPIPAAQAQYDNATKLLTYKGKQYKWDLNAQSTGQGEVVSAPSMAVGSRSMGPTNVELHPNGTYNRAPVNEAIKLNAPQKSWSKQDMQDYLTRIKTGTKTKQDRFKPIIHGSNVKAITKDDGTEEWDLEDLKRQITTPPRAILGSNAKMSKSKKEGAITYDLTLPALSGIVVDEETGEFVEITTCPGAGECQLFCYARKGGYVMFPAASMSAAQALNFLVNHPDEYMAMFDTEIKKTKALADKNGIKLLVRIHDAGDFFSKEYWDLSKKVQLNNPDVRFYFYSKMGDPVTDPNTPSNTLPNFSDGGAKSREVKKVELYRNAGKNLKGAPTIPKDMFRELFVTDAKGKYVKDEQGRTQVKSPEAWENFKQKLSTKYNIDPGSIITYDQMNRIPEGPKPKWNVVVFPAGHGDLGATRLDVQNQFLMFH